jgi:hypothetical protein
MRALTLTVLGVLALLTISATAYADPPTITPAPSTDFVDTTSCAFPVSIHYVVNGETVKSFTDGRTIVTGPVTAAFSANGKTVTLNISGPATITVSDTSVTFVGRGLGAGAVNTASGVTLGYIAGQSDVDLSTDVATIKAGRLLLDICGALAP